MKQSHPTIHISFSADDLDIYHHINKISSQKYINKSGLVRQILRKSLEKELKNDNQQEDFRSSARLPL